ncbi:ATP-binding protein [Streptomyces sp. 184]|uniref:ATP-binding protein n=1 Tax=Streptomyces sp. 184 TaxID=1827526 RepID=UPI003891E848
MRTPVQPDRQEGGDRRRPQRRSRRGDAPAAQTSAQPTTPPTAPRPSPRPSPRARAAYLVVGAAVLAAGAPGLVGALRTVRAADPARRAQAMSTLQLHGALLALCVLLAVGVVVYAARGGRGADTADGSGTEAGGAGSARAARAAEAELAAVRAELAEAKEHHVVERDSLLRERAALAERIGGLQASVQGTFVGLSRRTLGLVERQLSFIDELEAHEQEPGTLETLFRLDHLAACMRRHSENLLVLAGADHRGTRRANVPLIDVLRAAVGEIESYQRVVLSPDVPQMQVTGFASGDASHLLAELLENATSCSPPESEVLLTGRLLGTGDLLLVVRDEGIGISPAGRVDDLNARLADVDPGPAPREALGLGLYVVARLAARHGVGVELRQRDRGLDAEVRLPARLLVDPAGGGAVGGGAVDFAGGAPAAAFGGDAGHAVALPGAGGTDDGGRGSVVAEPGAGLGARAGGLGVRDGGAAAVRVGPQRSAPPPDGGVLESPPPFASARPAATPRTGGWVRAEAGMLPRRRPGGTVPGGAATGAPAAHGVAAHGAASDREAAVHAAFGHPAPGLAVAGHPAPGRPGHHEPGFDHPVPGHPAPGHPALAPAGAAPARALAAQRGAESSGGWPVVAAAPAAGTRTRAPVAAVPAQPERQAVDAREVRRLLGGLQQGCRDGRRAAAAEAATWEAKEQGAST